MLSIGARAIDAVRPNEPASDHFRTVHVGVSDVGFAWVHASRMSSESLI